MAGEKIKFVLISLLVVVFVSRATLFVACNENLKKPTVVIAILVRNKAHTLPYFLSLLERQNYPKERTTLWIRSDNNLDNTIEVLNTWLRKEGKRYHTVDVRLDEKSTGFKDEKGISDWSPQRFAHVINLREEALNYARRGWADYIWMLDADVFLMNPDTLGSLVSKGEIALAPLLKSDGMYSNFWAGMTENYYYLRTDRYEPILFRQEIGCFRVPMVHSAVLVDLRRVESDLLTYHSKNIPGYDGPIDDIIIFALAAKKSDIPLTICNDNVYGFVMVPLEKEEEGFAEDLRQLTNTKVEILDRHNYLPLTKGLERFVEYPEEGTLDMDNIYMINLVRRPERRARMQRLFKELGIRATVIDAVDGRILNESSLKEWGVKMMPGYVDPYHERPITMGEIGCFLSHFIIWKQVLDNGYKRVMVLEDDVRFEPFFNEKIKFILSELEDLQIDWDLVYLGRKRLLEKAENWVRGAKYLVEAAYSYWTLGYLLSAKGAKKLVEAKPLEKIVPVDEYIPILSDSHPRNDWKSHYQKRDLIILSANPLLIHPTHYTGDKGYISDTENSVIANKKSNNVTQNRDEL